MAKKCSYCGKELKDSAKFCSRCGKKLEDNHSQLISNSFYDITIDWEKCIGCGECADVCPVEAFKLINGKAVPEHADECIKCETCLEVCETDAIYIQT